VAPPTGSNSLRTRSRHKSQDYQIALTENSQMLVTL
jgi:hypothetical protein